METGLSGKPKTIEEYLVQLSDAQRTALSRLRDIIRRTAPDAQECISYQLPAFKHGRMLVSYGASAKHCAFYLMSTTVLDAFTDEITGFDVGKGTIRFTPERPLPESLVSRLVLARIAENDAASK